VPGARHRCGARLALRQHHGDEFAPGRNQPLRGGGAHAIITLDGAGWHRSGDKLKVPDNISLLLLPPYAPELNPQENIWQYLRQNYLANRVFKDRNAIINACCHAWNSLIKQKYKIASIATRSWALQVIN
jgi:transposase